MKTSALGFCLTLSLSTLFMGCDTADSLNKPSDKTRTMIIGGMPAHDHDYKVMQTESAWNEANAQEALAK
jgi:hypothetical protein